MRITTQMLNASAKKAGIPINNTSLLNFINNSSDNSNSILEALNKKQTTAIDTMYREKYEKLEKKADGLTQSAGALLTEGAGNLFAEAKESGDKQKLYDGIEKFFQNYNDTVTALKDTPDTLNMFYKQMLGENSEEVKESLKNIGITFKKDGTVNVDMDKVKEADIDTLESLFGSKSEFMSKVNYISTRISDNAAANAESLSSSYTANGSLYTANAGSKYNFWG